MLPESPLTDKSLKRKTRNIFCQDAIFTALEELNIIHLSEEEKSMFGYTTDILMMFSEPLPVELHVKPSHAYLTGQHGSPIQFFLIPY